MKKALITGITGQDGAYLAEFLLKKGYEVHGIKRRASLFNTDRIDHLYEDPHTDNRKLVLHYGDLTDATNLIRILQQVRPDEVYNLAAQSHVQFSFESPEYTADTDALGTMRILEGIRLFRVGEKTRFYQASTSELYGKVQEVPQTENTPFYPRSPYACAKLYAYWITVNYREAYNIYACNGILFNHESPIRGETFVTRKITRALCRIHLGLQKCLFLGNMNALRDWGHAQDYVEMQWLMLQQEAPDDYVIATGEQHSVREFVELSAQELGMAIEWQGQGIDEKGINSANGKTIVPVDPRYFRPIEVETLLGDPSKAKKNLGWEPKIRFERLVREMTLSDLEETKKMNSAKGLGSRCTTAMNKTDKIFIAGASGMVGSALVRNLIENGYTNLVGTYHSSIREEQKKMPITLVRVDLKDQAAVDAFFKAENPDHVFLAAAQVGGIHANNTWPARFIHSNLVIQANVIHSSYTHDVKRLLFLGSSCIYPKTAPQPMKEEHLLTGLLEPTNEPYAIAKIAGIKMCEAYNREYKTRFMAVMPTNLYGPNDNFDLETSHVLPALIRKIHEAKMAASPCVTIWGTGTPMREFLHVDDMAAASVHLMALGDDKIDHHLINYPDPCFVNLGTGVDCTINELAQTIKTQVGYTGKLVFDPAKPDGTPRKLLDISRIKALGWKPSIPLGQGIKTTYEWFTRFYTTTKKTGSND